MVQDGKSSQEHPINAGVPQGSILGPTLFLLYINEFPDDVICDAAIYTDDIILYSECLQASDLWQQLELASELESDLEDTITETGGGLLIPMLEKCVLFHRANIYDAIDLKMGRSLLEEKPSLKILGLSFSFKLH